MKHADGKNGEEIGMFIGGKRRNPSVRLQVLGRDSNQVHVVRIPIDTEMSCERENRQVNLRCVRKSAPSNSSVTQRGKSMQQQQVSSVQFSSPYSGQGPLRRI